MIRMRSFAILSLLFVVVSIVLAYFVVRPFWGEVVILRADVTSAKESLEKEKKLKAEVDAIVQEFDGLPEDTTRKLDLIIAPILRPAQLSHSLDSLSRRSGLVLVDLTFQYPKPQEAEEAKVKTVEFNATLGGRYPSFKTFAQELEKGLPLVDVTYVEFKSVDARSFLFSVRGQVYAKSVVQD